MRIWLSRVRRALSLDPTLFEEVEHDHTAGPQALSVVLAASVCGGFGNLMALMLLDREGRGGLEWTAMLVLTGAFFVAWLAWSFVTLLVGTLLFGGVADMGELQRTLGFAAAPGLLMLVPGFGVVASVPWSCAAMIIAVRQALDVSTPRALGTVLVSGVLGALLLLPPGCLLATRL